MSDKPIKRRRVSSPSFPTDRGNSYTSVCQHDKIDYITLLFQFGLNHVTDKIVSYLDSNSIRAAEKVSKEWQHVFSEAKSWKKLIERQVRSDSLWRGLINKHGWMEYLFKPRPGFTHRSHLFYRELFDKIMKDVQAIERNWKTGHYMLRRINCRSEDAKGVYCLQYDDAKIIYGGRDQTIKVWDRKRNVCVKTLSGHTGSVLCLQFDDKVIISGSSDSTVRVWNIETGEMIHMLTYHTKSVLALRFNKNILVTCSQDHSTAVWNVSSPTKITLRGALYGHTGVNVVDFNDKYIVTGGGDGKIRVWATTACEFVRTLSGHERAVACLQYSDRLVVSGSTDKSIRLWDIESGVCLRVLNGHKEAVRCLRFDSKRIVSGAYDGQIKVWDVGAALDSHTPSNTLCRNTFMEHTCRVYSLQLDDFQIVSCSHDDTIVVWNFLYYTPNESATCRTPSPVSMDH